MRLHHCVSRTFLLRMFSALAVATLTAGLAATVQAQSPASVPRQEPGGRAFWGIPAFPPLPVESPPDLSLAYYQSVGEPITVRPAGSHHVGDHHVGAHQVGVHHAGVHPSQHPAFVAGESGLPGAIVEGTRPAPFPYGYFGASGTRHWQRHFGFRQAYTQWTLK